jgi:acyl-coenzyme A thioesterase PaaI-like protein
LSSRSAEPAPFYTRYGLQRTGERESPLRLAPYPPIGRNGSLRATIVAAAVDIVGSLYTREQAGSDILYTTDLAGRLPHAGMPSLLRTHARSLRSGRSGSTTAVELFASETLWAYGETSFARQPRPGDASPPPEGLALPPIFDVHPLERSLDEEVGVRIVAAGRGEVELELRPAVLNREGTLQGALVALLVESAAECLAESRLGTPQRIAELDLRYLSTAKVGPVRSRARFIGDPETGMIRVELFDAGRGDRSTASALLRAVAAR